MGTTDDDLDRARDALAQGRPVIIEGTWGSGRSRLLGLLAPTACDGDPIVVDDAHLLTATAAADVAAGIRTGVPTIVTVARHARLPPVMRRALRPRDPVLVETGPLSMMAVARYVEVSVGHPVPSTAVAELGRLSGRVPALLVALVTDGLASGRLVGETLYIDDHQWRPGPALTDQVNGLFDLLTPAERDALRVLMVAGPLPAPATTGLLRGRTLDRLEQMGVVVELPADDQAGAVPDVALAAGAFVAAADRWITASRRRAILRRVAIHLTDLPMGSLSLQQQMHVGWLSMLGDGDIDVVRRGVRPAAFLGELDVAIELGRHVVRRRPDDERTLQDLAMAYEALGDHAAAAAVTETSTVQSASNLAREATNTYLATHDEAMARCVAGNAVGANDDDREAAANMVWLQLLTGDVIGVAATADDVLTAETASPQARLWACVVVGIADVVSGGGDGAIRLLDLAARIVTTDEPRLNPYAAFQTFWTRSLALVRLGRADDVLDAAEQAAAATPDAQLGGAWRGVAGLAARELGEFERGEALFADVLGRVTGDPFGLGTWASSEHAVCRAMLGETDAVSLDDARGIGFTESLLCRNRAWCAAAAGDATAARVLAQEAADVARHRSHWTHEALALVDLARFGRAGDALARASAIPRLDNPLVRAGGQVIAGLAGRDSEALIEAASVADRVGWRVARAELLRLARRALVRDGLPTVAACVELVAENAPWPTPILRAAEVPSSVTGRERQIGRAAVAGRQSSEIARDLEIARRTVDNVLGRLYEKCGVHSRRELSAAVRAVAPSRVPIDYS